MTMTNKMISFAMIEIVTMMCRPRVVSVEWRCQLVSSSHESSLWPPLLDYNSETEEILSSMDSNSIIAVVVRGQTSSMVFRVQSLSYRVSVITALIIKYLGVEL